MKDCYRRYFDPELSRIRASITWASGLKDFGDSKPSSFYPAAAQCAPTLIIQLRVRSYSAPAPSPAPASLTPHPVTRTGPGFPPGSRLSSTELDKRSSLSLPYPTASSVELEIVYMRKRSWTGLNVRNGDLLCKTRDASKIGCRQG